MEERRNRRELRAPQREREMERERAKANREKKLSNKQHGFRGVRVNGREMEKVKGRNKFRSAK